MQTQQPQTYPKALVYRGTRFEFNPHLVQFGDPKKTPHGSYVLNVTYPLRGTLRDGVTQVHADVPVVLQTPVMTTNFGFSVMERDGQLKGSVDFAFYDNDSDEVHRFKETMLLWDSILLATAKTRRVEWFKSNAKASDEIIEYLFCPSVKENVRQSDGKRFADSLKPKVRRRSDQWQMQCFDESSKPLGVEDVTSKSRVRGLLTLSCVWLTETSFVASLEATQVQVVVPAQVGGYGFIDDGNGGDDTTNICQLAMQ